jgi:CcmD family protein
MDNNMTYLFAAYSIIWAGVFIYVFILSRRERNMRKEISILKEELREKT